MLRQGISEKFASHPNTHSRLISLVSKEILSRDSVSSLDEFKIRKEHLHHLNGVVLNNEFSPEILNKLNASKFELTGENLEVQIPELPLSTLEKQLEAFKLWVQIKILSLDKPNAISYVRMKESDSIEIIKNGGMAFSFDMPEVVENEGVFGTVGFRSLDGGEMVKDVRLNGYVVVSF